MSRLDDLPPDQRATLSLLLRTRKSYADVAELLGIPERAVHDRAHAALAVLAAPLARALSPEQRAEVGDYLLSQRGGRGERLATRAYLDGSPPARAWANALAAELAPLSGASRPEIPAEAPEAPPASPAREPVAATADASPSETPPAARRSLPTPPSSRRAGALLLAAIVVVVVVVVVLASSGGGSSGSPKTSASGSTGASTSGSSSSAPTGASGARAKEDRRITLSSPDPTSKAVGVAEVLSEGGQYAFYLAAEHLPPSKGFFYAVWLYNSPTSFEALSRAPSVGSNGNLQGGALLPKDAAKYHTMLLTRETRSTPTSPGLVVLSGAFALH
ncbi:MAG TPA: sigma factor-like helix-turn-helix DNA-binding protein [Solirubrobacteraceae bacterium]|jgi:hypothetical protein|nr:sigma factor-like helix-turn-helix DNA-binding protein [Solirubrobacteraceae bacterium]